MNLNKINESLTVKIELLLEHFLIEVSDIESGFQGCCPVHDGDNPTAFSLSYNGNIMTWQCFTNNCHEDYPVPGLINFVHAMLKKSNDDIEFKDVIRWCLNFLGVENVKSFEEIKIDYETRNFIKWNKEIPLELPKKITTRQKTLDKLSIPSYYYVERGFSEEVLIRYDIGTLISNQGHFKDRVLVPIYSMSGTSLVGVAGRSLGGQMPKWKYDANFRAGSYFFNIWKAKDSIENTQTAILVEGQMDCVRMSEAGINNSLGIFGTSLSPNQMRLLNKLGATKIVLSLDNDGAGHKATKKIYEKLKRYYNLDVVTLNSVNDPGEASLDQLREYFNEYK